MPNIYISNNTRYLNGESGSSGANSDTLGLMAQGNIIVTKMLQIPCMLMALCSRKMVSWQLLFVIAVAQQETTSTFLVQLYLPVHGGSISPTFAALHLPMAI